ncbi:LOW QUALITY PROTEIN: olfactory receptor 2B11-like [Ctenodactylus gundi]
MNVAFRSRAPCQPHSGAHGVLGRRRGLRGAAPTDFVLLGVSDRPWLERPLFGVLLVTYVLATLGNVAIILAAWLDPQLSSPMCVVLGHLSLLDLCYTTATVPQMLLNTDTARKAVSCAGRAMQYAVFHWLGLAAVALDRCVAACQPLRYSLARHRALCQQLVATAWLSGLADALVQVALTVPLPFYRRRVLDDFFCEVPAMIKLSRGDTAVSDATLALLAAFFVLVPLALILLYYGLIARAVLQIRTSAGRRKAVGTCSSHLLVVSLFYLPAIYMYLQPPSGYAQEQAKFVSLFDSIVTPTLSPSIYTLRNRDVKAVLGRLPARLGGLCPA